MKKTFVITENNQKYAIVPCTAIAVDDDENEACRQDALYVVSLPLTYEMNAAGEYYISGVDHGAEVKEDVVFNWNVPESSEDFAGMCDDRSSWEPYVDTVKINGISLCELRERLGGTLGLL